MTTLIRYLAMAAFALALPVFATTASAAEMRLATPEFAPVTGGTTMAHDGLLSAKAEPEKIQVAGRRGRRLGAAIVGGIVAGALIAGAARAHKHRYHYNHAPRYRPGRCERLYWRCEDGIRRACRRYYRHCY